MLQSFWGDFEDLLNNGVKIQLFTCKEIRM